MLEEEPARKYRSAGRGQVPPWNFEGTSGPQVPEGMETILGGSAASRKQLRELTSSEGEKPPGGYPFAWWRKSNSNHWCEKTERKVPGRAVRRLSSPSTTFFLGAFI